jgi:four helix bundle protein
MAELSRLLRRGEGMTPTKQGSHTFHVVEIALRLIRSLRQPVARVRKRNARLAGQIEEAGCSVVANLLEGNRRTGRDRGHLFRVAAGSADETRAHLLTAEAWGWVERAEIDPALDHADHVLAILWKLTR